MTAHPAIDPVSPGIQRPFWSVMIPTCNPNLEYLQQTLAAVLAQDPGPDTMEIAIVDDGSDRVDPRDCLRTVAPGRITFFRHERRLGLSRNWNACLSRARGQWVHLLHQDDLVRPGFYDRLRQGIESAPAVGAALCRDVVVDEEGRQTAARRLIRPTPGILEDWIENLFLQLNFGPEAIVVKRSVYEALGGFSPDFEYAFDWDMWKRIATAYPIWYEPATLACYRGHDGSASSRFIRSGQNIVEIGRSIDLSARLLKPAIADDVVRQARLRYAGFAVRLGWKELKARRVSAGLAQIREARKLTSSLAVARAIRRLFSAEAGRGES